MKLSILIPTIHERRNQCEILIIRLLKYSDNGENWHITQLETGYENCSITRLENEAMGIEIIAYEDNKEISIGEKRDRLYKLASGEFSWQIDDDDAISPDAIDRIMAVLKNELPDCVTFEERCEMDGVLYKSNHSSMYEDWKGDGNSLFPDGFHFHRTPFFKSVILTAYCKHIGVADMRFGEDHEFSRLIKPLLSRDYHILGELYYYNHVSSEHNERYGIKEPAK